MEMFSEDQREWQDVKEEIRELLSDAERKLKSPSCEDRDYYAGKCFAFQEIIDLEEHYKDMVVKNEQDH